MPDHLRSRYIYCYFLTNLALFFLITNSTPNLNTDSTVTQATSPDLSLTIRNSSSPEALAPNSAADSFLQFTAAGHLLAFGSAQMILANSQYALQVQFIGANPITPHSEEESLTNSKQLAKGGHGYLSFPNPKSKTENLKSVSYSNLWPGITLVYESTPTAIAKSTYIIAPEIPSSSSSNLTAKINQIRLQYNVPVHLDSTGNLILEFETGHLQESAPIAWQEINGLHIPVEVYFVLLTPTTPTVPSRSKTPDGSKSPLWQHARGTQVSEIQNLKSEIQNPIVGLAVGLHHPAYPLIIDPSLTWHTFLGSGDDDKSNAIAVDGAGNVFITGYSNATWGSPVNPYVSNDDAFVAKLDSNGIRQWHTFLGSGSVEHGNAIAVDEVGNIYITGHSSAPWGAPINPYIDGDDAFVAKLNSNGIRQWHTFLGSASEDAGQAIAVDRTNNVYVAGGSGVTWGAPVNPHAGGLHDAFVAKLNSNGIRQWHTFLGSGDDDFGRGIVVDGADNVFITGYSGATWGAPVNPHAGGPKDAFVIMLNSNGIRQWHTFLGSGNLDDGYAITVDGAGSVFVAGYSSAAWGLPVNPYVSGQDAFVARLNSNGLRQWHTFLGSGNLDDGQAIAVDGAGNIYIAGYSGATWGTPINSYAGSPNDAFVAKVSSPYITGATPAPNSHTASLTGTLTLSYSLPLNAATVSEDTVVIHAGQTGHIIPNYVVNSNTVKLIPTSPFSPGEIIQVTSSRELLGTAYSENVSPRVWQFRAEVKVGAGVFTSNGQGFGGGDISKVALGDLDGDGDLDAFVARAGYLTPPGPPNKVWRNNGQGTLIDTGQSLGNRLSTAIALGDLDRDGDLDAFVGNWSGQTDEVWLNNGLGQFNLHSNTGDNDWAYDVALGDLDADGDLDALVANDNGEPDTVWLNDGQANFSHGAESGYNLGNANGLSVALGDLDNDGDLDVLVGNEFQSNEVWRNDGWGRFSRNQTLNNSYSSWDIALGDLDGDRDLDAFIANGSPVDNEGINQGQPDQLWFNDGQGQFTQNVQLLENENSHAVSLADIDADSDLDAVVANFEGGWIWYNQGQGSLEGGHPLIQAYGWSVDVGDLDSDGDLDAFFGNSFNQANQVWSNQGSSIELSNKSYLPLLVKPNPKGLVTLIITSLNTEGIKQIRVWDPAQHKDVLSCGLIGNNVTQTCGEFPPIGSYQIFAYPNKIGCGDNGVLTETFNDAIGGAVVIRSVRCF